MTHIFMVVATKEKPFYGMLLQTILGHYQPITTIRPAEPNPQASMV